MSRFILLYRLLCLWEICSSVSHAIRYSIEEAIRLQIIKPQSLNTDDIPPMKIRSKARDAKDILHQPREPPITNLGFNPPPNSQNLTIKSKKKKFHDYKTILKVNKEDKESNEERRNTQVPSYTKLTKKVNFLRRGRYVADT